MANQCQSAAHILNRRLASTAIDDMIVSARLRLLTAGLRR